MVNKLAKLKIFDQRIEALQEEISEIRLQKYEVIKQLNTAQFHVVYRFLKDYDWSVWAGNQRVIIHINKDDKIHTSLIYYGNQHIKPDFSNDLYEYDLATVEETIFLQDLLDELI